MSKDRTLKELLLTDDLVALDTMARKLEDWVQAHPEDEGAKRLMHLAFDLQAGLFTRLEGAVCYWHNDPDRYVD